MISEEGCRGLTSDTRVHVEGAPGHTVSPRKEGPDTHIH